MVDKMITVIDYGMGNIKSVRHAFVTQGYTVEVTGNPGRLEKAKGLVLPGVGAFGEAVYNLNRQGALGIIREKVLSGTPFLGICLGMQLIFEKSEEAPGVKGLSLLKGSVVRFRGNFKVPLIGWNRVFLKRKCRLFEGIGDGSFFYFVHSYFVKPAFLGDVAAYSNHGNPFPAAVVKKNFFGLQFHPEKSSGEGLKIIDNFGKLVREQWR